MSTDPAGSSLPDLLSASRLEGQIRPTQENTMAVTDKLKSLLNSPTSRQAMKRGRQELSKPENQQKIKNALSKLTMKR